MIFNAFTMVCNGALTIEACIRHHAPLFDHYVVVEGPALEIPTGRGSGLRMTGGKPRSTDGTVLILAKLEAEIPNLHVIYSAGEPNPSRGEPWQGKTAMCNAALEFCEPGWLVQIDADEFWEPMAVKVLKEVLPKTDYTDAEFFARHFWPTIDYHTAINGHTWGNQIPWRRWFRWQGEPWKSHEPPKLGGNRNVLSREITRAMGIMMHHYGYCVEKQFRDRELFYGMEPGRLVNERNEWLKTKNVESSPAGKLVKYDGPHPLDVAFLREK